MIPGLDGLRAIAFLLVFLFHTEYLQFGWVGVQLFFVLSGFLITSILIDMKGKFQPKDYFMKFYGRRALRIFPLYYFYLFLMLLLSFVFLQIEYRPLLMKLYQEQLPYALAYIYNFHYAGAEYEHLYFLVHFWSLSVEEQFYIFWPLIIFVLPEKLRKNFFLLVVILIPVFRTLVILGYKYQFFSALNPTPAMGIYPITVNHFDAFGFGALLTIIKIPKAKLQLLILTILLPLASFFWHSLFDQPVDFWGTLGYEFIMPARYQFIWGYSALNYYFAVLVYVVAKERLFFCLLEGRFIKYLGQISYGLYVYHNGVIWFSSRLRDFGVADENLKFISTMTAFFITLLLASLTYQFIESPFLTLKDKWFPVRKN